MSQHEYSFLIRFYADVVGFPVVISTFRTLTEEERIKLDDASKALEEVMKNILPKLQDREDKV